MRHPKDRITRTTAFVTPVVEHWLERESLVKNRIEMEKNFASENEEKRERFLSYWCYEGRRVNF